jgi:organic hydroperoxide reductase OsmC/OhrA
MGIVHTYEAAVTWTGAQGTGTTSYTSYSRNHDVLLEGKPPLPGSSDPAFRGDPSRYCPEELMVAALAQCHMLWFLHLAASDGVVVVGYTDRATGRMRVEAAGHGQFTEVVLRPCVTIAAQDRSDGRPITDEDLAGLHRRSREHCFIARSVNFAVRHEPAPVRVAMASAEPLGEPA